MPLEFNSVSGRSTCWAVLALGRGCYGAAARFLGRRHLKNRSTGILCLGRTPDAGHDVVATQGVDEVYETHRACGQVTLSSGQDLSPTSSS